MRVTGGAARGRRLKSPRGGVRPTTDRVRAAIFGALEAQGVDLSKALDLYAGSGALGIEALSRGGGWCDFVEREAANVALIRENLALAGLRDRGRVHRMTVERAPARLAGPYSIIFSDAPYDDVTALDALKQIAESPLAGADTILVVEQSSRIEAARELGPLALRWNRRYGDCQMSIYRCRREASKGALRLRSEEEQR